MTTPAHQARSLHAMTGLPLAECSRVLAEARRRVEARRREGQRERRAREAVLVQPVLDERPASDAEVAAAFGDFRARMGAELGVRK